MKTRINFSSITLVWLLGVYPAAAQTAQFFRISGPAATTITAFRPDGTMVWSNGLAGTNYTVQTLSALSGGSNWVDYLQLPVSSGTSSNRLIDPHPPTGMAFIPAGQFTMGDTLDGESDALPVTVTVSAFYMDAKLVSYAQWQTVYNWATNHGYGFNNAGAGKAANHPVQMVDWFDAVKWCNARSQMEGLTPVYYTNSSLMQVYTNGEGMDRYFPPPIIISYVNVNWAADGYRLPTEAEWEKAARGGMSGHRFPWGDLFSRNYANGGGAVGGYDIGPSGYNPAFTNGGYPYTSPVGYFAPNGYGLYDMSGNVWEWCWDLYGTPYAGGTNPHGGTVIGNGRIIRGGSYNYTANNLRCAQRGSPAPTTASMTYGFRCVRGH